MDSLHFLDTNIILAMILPNDNSFEESNEYLSKNFQRYISTTACCESEEKIESIRRISLKIIDFINEYSLKNNINPLNSYIDHNRIKNEFLSQYGDDEYPENIKHERFVNLVSEFFKMHETEINDLLLRHDDTDLTDTVKSTYRKCLNKFPEVLNKHYCITFIDNASKVDELKGIEIHKKDAILLDETYRLQLFLKNIAYFITFDKDILEKYELIQRVLNDNIHVTHPSYFN